MKRKRFGFTLIEVALFLAITGLLFMGIIMGTGNSISKQRFFDSTQSFAEFLRSVYSQVSNPQSVGDGRGNLAIYGKLISFGQHVGLDGNDIPDGTQKVFVYDIVGDVSGKGSGTAASMLSSVQANVVVFRDAEERILKNDAQNSVIRSVGFAGLVESYEPHWEASVETTAEKWAGGVNNLYEGTILVVRHPTSGTINTLVYSKTAAKSGVLEINRAVKEAGETGNYSALATLLTDALSDFEAKEVDFCINPDGWNNKSERRWDVRLVENARNSSGVEVIELDNEGETPEDNSRNKCRF